MDDFTANRRLYEAVKQRLVARTPFGAGRISPAGLADENRVSVTPVREALFRLVGERLVGLVPDGGFTRIVMDAPELADAHAWNGHHLLAALHLLPEGVVEAVLDSNGSIVPRRHADVVERIEMLFVSIGRATGNREFVRQIEGANDRLREARLVEERLFADTTRELRTILRRVVSDAKPNVRRRVVAYHRRRVEHAGQIAALLSDG